MIETAADFDVMGSVEYLVLEFPRGRSTFDHETVAELSRLSHEGLIRVLDLLVIQKAADGSVAGFEVEELEMDEIQSLAQDLADLLAATDVERLAGALEPGTVAGVVVWENLWSIPLTSTARWGGGQLIAAGHIPLEAIADSLESEEGGE
jgi:Family of unknown function (DUF6325)